MAGTVRSLLFDSRSRTIGTTLLALLALLALAGGSLVAAGAFDEPRVVGIEGRFAGVNESATTVAADVTVRNPTPFGLALDDATANYAVGMNGIRMAAGSERDLSLPRGRTTIPVGLALDNERIPAWWVSHVRRGERTTVRTAARVNASVLGRTVTAARTDEMTFETDIAGRFDTSESRPVDAGLPVVPDPLFVVERTNATWGRVSSEETPLNATFVLANPRDFPLPIVAFEYAVSMNGVRVGNGATEGGVVPPGGRRAIAARTVIENDRLDEWWVSHVRRGQRTDVRIEFAARIELPTGGVVRVALDEFTYTDTFETDVFGADGADDATEIRATGGGIDRAVSPAAG